MLATDKQIAYLEDLQGRLNSNCVPRRDWRRERARGLTTKDASARIEAYKRIIAGADPYMIMLGFRQF